MQQNYRDTIQADPHILQLQKQLTDAFGIEPTVAAYALVATGFVGVESAFDFICEKDPDSNKVAHKFFGYSEGSEGEQDIESGRKPQICLVCGLEESVHKTNDEELLQQQLDDDHNSEVEKLRLR